MSRIIKCAHIQMSNPKDDGTPAEIKAAMIEKHIPLIQEAGEKGVNILCLQEIFHGPYFCCEQDTKWYATAEKVPGPTTERLAEYAISTRFDDLPEVVVHETKRRMIDALGCAMGARVADTPRVAERVASRIAAEPAATTLDALLESSS